MHLKFQHSIIFLTLLTLREEIEINATILKNRQSLTASIHLLHRTTKQELRTKNRFRRLGFITLLFFFFSFQYFLSTIVICFLQISITVGYPANTAAGIKLSLFFEVN
ncbi:hypothetical protein BDW42DRAFT_147576 [Aspergillus taichungensis]|uniref:Uncharacterized protein n=1 Tax=Aspergillus taichungensis TaxID=482145 RepID=A0A2J5HLM2_9EURO|nr:hypothetical protein BDW42DRAFT_147576 [Aspergillus taichungensis]